VQQNITLGTNANGTLGVVANGSDLMVAASSGMPATGTTLYGLNANLTAIGAPSVRVGDMAATTSIASNGESIAFASQLGTTEVDVRLITTAASDASAVQIIAPAAKSASNVSVIASGGGYAMAYSTQLGAALGGEIALLDAGLGIVAGPTAVGTSPNHDAYRPAIAWAPDSSTYLVAWHEKDASGQDNLWAELLDPAFQPIGGPITVTSFSTNVSVSTDGKDFWLSFRTYDPLGVAQDYLAAAQVTAGGVVTPYPIMNSGGKPNQWTVTARSGQSVVVWTEAGGSGPDLYFDPMCP
jgi:hypothetical protein